MALRQSTDRVCLFDLETTYGVAATMTAADAILMMESDIQPMADKLERVVDRPFFGGDPFVLVNKRVQLTGTIDVIGSATPGISAPLAKVYKACQHAETLIAAAVGPPIVPAAAMYNPISRSISSATIDFYWCGIKFRMLGARGSMDFDYSIKQYGKATVTLTGLLVLPTDGEPPGGIDWSAFQTPAAIESGVWTVTVDGVNVCAQQLTMAQNATVGLIECSEAREVMVTARKPGGTLKVLKDADLATWNPWAIADAQAIIPLVSTIVKADGLNVEHIILAQLEYPKPTDIEGVAGFEIPFTAVPTGAGNDEYTFRVY